MYMQAQKITAFFFLLHSLNSPRNITLIKFVEDFAENNMELI